MSDKDAVPKAAAKRGKGLIIAIAAVVLVAGASAGGWYLMSSKADPSAEHASQPSIFLPLEQFTVNLADDGGERFAQIAVTLEVASSATEANLKTRMPALRNAILLEISSMRASDLLSVPGKARLASRIAEIGGAQAGWSPAASQPSATGQAQPRSDRPNPVRAVHFSHFIIQ